MLANSFGTRVAVDAPTFRAGFLLSGFGPYVPVQLQPMTTDCVQLNMDDGKV